MFMDIINIVSKLNLLELFIIIAGLYVYVIYVINIFSHVLLIPTMNNFIIV